eukprot:8954625-Ditylum_brightwellii.AAC.1
MISQLLSRLNNMTNCGTNICRFNIGGHKYDVSKSLLEQHPNTMLARISSEQWQKDPEAEIFIDRDGDRFRYCLDYLRDGSVVLPATVSKKALLQDLVYYGVEDVDEGNIDDGLERGLRCATYMLKAAKESNSIIAAMRKENKCLEAAIDIFHCFKKTESLHFSMFK